MKLTPYNESAHYPVLAAWWKGWNLPVTPERYLPKEGLVVLKDGQPVCAGFVFQMSQTPLHWIEGIVSDPNGSGRKEALAALIAGLSDIAKERGCELLMGSTPRESLSNLFLEQGFNTAPERYIHLGRLV